MAITPEDSCRIFGGRLRRLRTRLGWSQEKLAFDSGLDRSYVGGVERGERNISLKNIYRLAKALGVPARDLFDPIGSDVRSGKKRTRPRALDRRDKNEPARS